MKKKQPHRVSESYLSIRAALGGRRVAKHFFKNAKPDRFCALKIAQKQPQR
ncbi:hypothetical protein HMPREF9554_02786 [Treponema phagedenis F0421]|nr:hypothetical protein HMPREF9554_02786 [Treponema phagedenis F0421]